MFKKMAIAAMAASCVVAFGQGNMSGGGMNSDREMRKNIDASTASWEDLSKSFAAQTMDLPAGHQYALSNFLSRLPSNYEHAILKAVASNYQSASMIHNEMVMSRGSMNSMSGTMNNSSTSSASASGTTPTTSTDPSSTTSTTGATSTTGSNDPGRMNNSQSMMSNGMENGRAMRMVMQKNAPRDVDYEQALSILSENLNDTERGQLRSVFAPRMEGGALRVMNERALDALIMIIRNNADMADMTHGWRGSRSASSN